MQDWQEEARRLRFEKNQPWTEIYSSIHANYFPNESAQKIAERVRSFIRNQPEYQKPVSAPLNAKIALEKLLIDGCTALEASKILCVSERTALSMIQDMVDDGLYAKEINGIWRVSKVAEFGEAERFKRDWNGDKIIRFGLTGDPQIGSKYTQITHLHKFYDICEHEGIIDVYNTGDITDGEKMRPGHEYEIYVHGADEQVAEVEKVYPKRNGITTRFITGNHDHSFIKQISLNIGAQIAMKRPDMEYLGLSQAFIELTDNCTLELRHPEDGTAYAYSYKIQKMIEAMSGGEKPNIFACGHYHKAEYLPIRNVHCIQTGCNQAQTPWMRGKSIAAIMGNWILEIHVNDDGSIRRIKPEFFPEYVPIKEDWKNWR